MSIIIHNFTHKRRSAGTPAYLSHLIHDYLLASTLRSSDKLLLSVHRIPLALSAKAFSVSAPSVWNSLSYNCRSAELLSIFKRNSTRSSATAKKQGVSNAFLFTAKLLSIAIMTYSYVYHLRNLRPANLLRTQRINFSMQTQHVRMTPNPLSFEVSFLENPTEYPHKPYIARN